MKLKNWELNKGVKKEINSLCSWKLKRTIHNTIVLFNSHFNSPFNSLLVFCFYLLLFPAIGGAQESRTSQHKVFDDRDRLAVLITYSYDTAGVVETRQLQSFDREGRLTRTELYTVDEQLLFTEDIRYDRRGNRVRCLQTTYDEQGYAYKAEYKYTYKQQADGSYLLALIRLNGEIIYAIGEE